MPKPNYQFEKRQRELEKKKKKAEKAQRKATGPETAAPVLNSEALVENKSVRDRLCVGATFESLKRAAPAFR